MLSISVVHASTQLLERIASVLPPEASLRSLRHWSPEALDAIAIIFRFHSGVNFTKALSALNEARFSGPTILVVDRISPVLEAHQGLFWSRVIAEPALERSLRPILATAVRASLSEQLIALAVEATRFGPVVREAVEKVFRSDPPPTSVPQLARSVYVSVSTLRSHWRRDEAPGSPYQLIEFGILASATLARERGAKLVRVAAELKVSPSTLKRIARRRTNHSPSQLSRELLKTHFESWVKS